MGYEASGSGWILIPTDKLEQAKQALMEFTANNDDFRGAHLDVADTAGQYIKEVLDWTNFEDIDSGLNGVTVHTFYGNSWLEEAVFKVLAPYVRRGSDFYFSGDDDLHWRWTFEDGHMYESEGTVVFGDPKQLI